MNLQELREMVGSIVDYDPDVQTYRDEVTRVLNELYLDFFTDKPWKFAVKTAEVPVFKDATFAGNMTAGSRLITGVGFPSWTNGAVVEITGSTSDDNEYEIEKRSPTQIYLKGFSATNTEAVSVTIKQRYVDMPQDCAEVLAVGLRNPTQTPTTSFNYLARLRDEQYGLLLSSTGQPTDWLIHDDVTVIPPVLAPTPTDGGAGGAHLEGETHVKYTFIYQNRESSSSPDSVVFLGAGGVHLDISDLQTTGNDSGRQKRIYVRTVDTNAYYHIEQVDSIEGSTSIAQVTLPTEYLVSQTRLPENSGHYKRVRLYPRQDTDYDVTVRYIYQPPRLLEGSDTPEFPPSHHRYLVYRACQELFVKHDNLSHSEVYRRKADIELLRLQNNYLSEGAGSWEMQSFTGLNPSLRANTTLTWLG